MHLRTPIRITSIAVAVMLLGLLVSACGEEEKAETPTATTQEKAAHGEGAAGHFADALEALEEGKLTGPEGAEDHLEEALTVTDDLPKAKEEAEEALEAIEKGDKEEAEEKIKEGLEASEQEPVGAPTATVDVSLGEWFVKPNVKSVKAGNIQFKATNDGKLEHELVVVKTDLAPSKLPVKGGKVDEGKAGEVPGEIEEFAPGKTEEMTLALKPGKYVLFCNIPGHYKNGQYVGLTVT